MKSLLLIRHAKSSWETGLPDFDRPLNERGRKDAPVMAERLLNRKVVIDTFISSAAKRARQTTELFTARYKPAAKDVYYRPYLYLATPAILYKAIENIDDQYTAAAIFSHNPGLTELANKLTQVQVDNIPTCGIYAVAIQADHWADFVQAEKRFLFFDYPKNLAG